MTNARSIRAGLIIAIAVVMGGCVAMRDRASVPGTEIEAARVSGYGDIRFWGDEVTPTIEAVIRRQYSQVRQAASTGEPGVSTRKAQFLAISGGGGDGAYAAGFLTGWTRSGQRPHFEVVTGVSAGALIAPYAYLCSSYDNQLAELWTRFDANSVATPQVIAGLLGADALADSTPLRNLIARHVDRRMLADIAR